MKGVGSLIYSISDILVVMYARFQSALSNMMLQSRLLIPLLLIFVHAVVSYYLYLNSALIPDEIWFIEYVEKEVQQNGLLEIFNIHNAFGYGALYWFIHHLSFLLFEDPWLGIRGIYWLFLVTSDVLLLAIVWRINPARGVVVLALYMTLPMVWWQGKITGPEPLAHVLFLSGIFIAVVAERRTFIALIACLVFGLSLGVKLSTAPQVFACLSLLFWYHAIKVPVIDVKSIVRIGSGLLLATVVGFVIANPFVLVSPESLLANIPSNESDFPFDGRVKDVLFGTRWLWEVVPIGSATEFGASWWLVVLLFAISIFRGAHASVFWVFSFGIMGSLIFPMLTPSFFGWYLYSAIMLLPLMLAFGQRERGLLTGGLTVVMILLSLKCNTGLVAEMVSNKIDHMKVLSMKEGITKHFGGLVSSWQPDLVVDYSEYNLIMFTPDKLEELAGHSIEQIGITERRKLDALKYMWNHSLSWLRNESGEVIACPKIDGYSRVLFAFGERLTHHKPPLNVSLRDWTERTFTRECPGWQLEYYEMHNQVHYLVIGNDVPQAIN